MVPILFSTFLMLQAVACFTTTKFVEWFPRNHTEFENFRESWTTGPCKTLYDNFVKRGEQECGDILNCLIEHETELQKTTYASAQVVLGLIPPLLAGVGNSVPELSILASQRPFLSFLLTLGAPSMYLSRISEYINPFEILDSAIKSPLAGRTTLILGTTLPLLQYFLAAGAVANNIELALRIGSQSVLVWGCRSWYMPLVWVLFPISTYTIASLSCHIVLEKQQHAQEGCSEGFARGGIVEDMFKTCLQCLQVCIHLPLIEKGRPPPQGAVLLQMIAACLAFVHVVLGTLILASLVFVGFHDTLYILARFLSSVLVCRIVALLQLSVIRSRVGNAA